MPVSTKKSATKSASKPITRLAKKASTRTSIHSSKGSLDAIKLLTNDHNEVKKLFKAYEELVEAEGDNNEKQKLAHQICTMLTAHATVEEEIFYPAARQALEDHQNFVDEANVEHSTAKNLIEQIESSTPEGALYDAKVKVLGEYIDHHVKEEEGEMFPNVKKSDLDLDALGTDMAARKEELFAELSEGALA
jgi:hemerythrin superfamily protein